jgi:hypothetical protein
MSPMGGCGVSANKYSCAHGAQINFGDYLTYGCTVCMQFENYFFFFKPGVDSKINFFESHLQVHQYIYLQLASTVINLMWHTLERC